MALTAFCQLIELKLIERFKMTRPSESELRSIVNQVLTYRQLRPNKTLTPTALTAYTVYCTLNARCTFVGFTRL